MLVSETKILRAGVPRVNGNPTGAGDAMVAGLAIGLAEGLKDADLLVRSCALGSAAVAEEIAGRVDLERMAEFQDKITVSEVEL
jgi:tagatose 6-phosphate kinase